MSSQPSPSSTRAASPKPPSPGSTQLPYRQASSSDTTQTSEVSKLRSISFAAPSPRSSKPRSISLAAPSPRVSPQVDHRASIQFAPSSEKPDRSITDQVAVPEAPVPARGPRRLSPPPPSTYHPRVSFDTFNNPSVTDQEFTLVCKHNGYTYERHQRVFLVAIDQNAYSEHALKWLIEDMVEDGDEVICLRVVENDPKAKEGATSAQMATYKEDAKELLKQIQKKNDAADKKAISIIMEFAVGNVEQIILHMINIYSPAFLTVGTRGKSLGGLQGLLPGSVSKWCMQNSPVPVVVVRHPDKRQKKMNKRQNDPNRRGYATILDKSASIPGSVHTTLKGGKIIEAEAGEAKAVAKALGLTSNLASWKGFGFKKEGDDILTISGSSAALLGPSVKNETTEPAELNDKKHDDEAEQKEDQDDEDEDDDDDDEEEIGGGDDEAEEDEDEDGDGESPMGVMYAESHGIETMPNYVDTLEDDVDDDVERLALSDEEDRQGKRKLR